MKTKEFNAQFPIGWYIKRIRVMSVPEILHRIEEQCAIQMMYAQHTFTDHAHMEQSRDIPGTYVFCQSFTPHLPQFEWDEDRVTQAQHDLLEGRVSSLGYQWTWKPDGTSWHQAPDSLRQWPKKFFAHIPYRRGNPYGDIRLAWEPSRLQHLIALALLAQREGEEASDRALDLLENQFLSWVRSNPFLTGIHYISAMECGLRILAVCHALDLVRSRLTRPAQVWRGLLQLIRGHARFIAKRISRHSSRGNHTVAEASGLVYAGLLFPEMAESARWYTLGMDLLAQEILHQIHPDGGSVEQSFAYHDFILDLYGLTARLLRHHQRTVPPLMEELVTRGEMYRRNFSHATNRLPTIGDGDDGHALSPYLRMEPSSPRADDPGNSRSSALTYLDYTLITGRNPKPFQVIFDHGPLGMAPCYGHGHADALAVQFRLGNQELLIDPGTYSYGGDSQWREYFRSTSAHNTVMVDGLDQAVQESPFIWSHPYSCSVVRYETDSEGTHRVLASHDGYQSRTGVRHWRGMSFTSPRFWVIWDYLEGAGTHALDLHWHLNANVMWDGVVLRLPAEEVQIFLTVQGGSLSLHAGETNPILGWHSPQYGIKIPIKTLRSRYRGPLPHEFVTSISFTTIAQLDTTIRSEVELFRKWIHEATTH